MCISALLAAGDLRDTSNNTSLRGGACPSDAPLRSVVHRQHTSSVFSSEVVFRVSRVGSSGRSEKNSRRITGRHRRRRLSNLVCSREAPKPSPVGCRRVVGTFRGQIRPARRSAWQHAATQRHFRVEYHPVSWASFGGSGGFRDAGPAVQGGGQREEAS